VIRVALADDSALVRAGFSVLLDAEPGVEVVGVATNGREAVELARAQRPHVLLMDIRMPEMDGIEATRQIAADPALDDVRVLILTTFELDEYIVDALRAGASGFLLKRSSPEELIAAIHTVADGEALLSPSVTRRLMERVAAHPILSRKPDPRLAELTTREREVFELVAQGLSNAEIAEALTLERTTIKTHVQRILNKLEVRNRVEVVIVAYEWGLITPGHTPHSAA
jgi:DNA-binding NarL/FixJ family response regulator